MTFLRRRRGQAFLAERKVVEWSFPCEVVQVVPEGMLLKQYIPEGGEEDYVEPEMSDCLIEITLEPEILELVYVYEPYYPAGSGELEIRTDGRGMHIEGTWYQLTNGMWYMDQVTVFPELGVTLIVVCVAVICA